MGMGKVLFADMYAADQTEIRPDLIAPGLLVFVGERKG